MTVFAVLSGLGHTVLVMAGLLVYVLATRIRHQRRNPSAAVAWVIAMVSRFRRSRLASSHRQYFCSTVWCWLHSAACDVWQSRTWEYSRARCCSFPPSANSRLMIFRLSR